MEKQFAHRNWVTCPGPHRNEAWNLADLALSTAFFPPTRPCGLSCTWAAAKATTSGLNWSPSGPRTDFGNCVPQLTMCSHLNGVGPSRQEKKTHQAAEPVLRSLVAGSHAGKHHTYTLNSNLEIVKGDVEGPKKGQREKDGKKSKCAHGCSEN